MKEVEQYVSHDNKSFEFIIVTKHQIAIFTCRIVRSAESSDLVELLVFL